MHLHRRSLLLAAGGAALAPVLAPARARADATDPRLTERAIGPADAPVKVTEWFSLTCPHCARFTRDTFPEIKDKLITPGKLRYVFGDFPLDQVALTAAMIARALPPERYEPFILALLASQDRWAFRRDVNTTEELWKMAALAGLSRQAFDATIADTKLRDGILTAQDDASKQFGIDSTPTFIFDGPTQKGRRDSGELTYDKFAKIYTEVGGTLA
jgi:protein-disulfide isomerase